MRLLLFLILVLAGLSATAQVQIKGTVYDRTARYGMAGVSVMSTSGAGTVTDSLGHYSIRLGMTDSLSFSYQGKATQKFPVKTIPANRPFEISMHVDIKVLPTVEVRQTISNYHTDSLAFRNEYRKVFDYTPEYISSANGGVGLNIDALLSIRKIKRMEHFRQYMEQYERDKYVDHRFNKALITKLTGLQEPAVDTFMLQYRPSYETLMSFQTEYDYYEYIKYWGQAFKESH
jgi:hypothetical protein